MSVSFSHASSANGLADATKALDQFKQHYFRLVTCGSLKSFFFLVVVRFKATGSAPIMKQNFFKITSSNRFQAVIAFLRKELGLKPTDPVFLYINSSFSPAPDETVANLFKCFSTDGHLIVNYRFVDPKFFKISPHALHFSQNKFIRSPRSFTPLTKKKIPQWVANFTLPLMNIRLRFSSTAAWG
ncbi:hypothetical protein VP01_375g6 [Puccinia sorghi]|uniref:Ubiquitin-like protein ATG12 n=1 Tax=Puccinia sorghi TaxID=27349 RepID=A0A0L6UTS5_9BASI|nr:hypothetical protein VP01_375g6 [Puccinia sorghi]